MKQRICALSGSLLLLWLLVACSGGDTNIDCRRNFATECEQELSNRSVLSNPILKSSLTATGCSQHNLKACSMLQRALSPRSQMQFDELESLQLDPMSNSNLSFRSDPSGHPSIKRDICGFESFDYRECVDFISSLQGWLSGLAASTKSFNDSSSLSLVSQSRPSTSELGCYDGNLLDCDSGKAHQLARLEARSQVQTFSEGNGSTEIKSSAKICYFKDNADPVCREYSGFSPKDFEKSFGVTKVSSALSSAGRSSYRHFANAVCNGDVFCTEIIGHTINDDAILDRNNVDSIDEQVNSDMVYRSSFTPPVESRIKANHSYSDKVSSSQVRKEKFANAVCNGDTFCSTIISGAINPKSVNNTVLVNKALEKKMSPAVMHNSTVVDDTERKLNSSSQSDDSSYQSRNSDQKQVVFSSQNKSFATRLDKERDPFDNRHGLGIELDSPPSDHPDSDLKAMSKEEFRAAGQLGDAWMKHQLAENFQILESSIDTGREMAANEARNNRQQEWQRQLQRLQLLEDGRKKGQIEEIARMQDRASQNIQALLFSIDKGQEKGAIKKQQQQLQEHMSLSDPKSEKIGVVDYPAYVQALRVNCDNHSAVACYQLANILYAGKVVSENKDQARKIYDHLCQMAQKENIEGQYYCARLNIEGNIVEPHLGQAAQLLNRSCQRSFQPACQSLEMLKQINVNITSQ